MIRNDLTRLIKLLHQDMEQLTVDSGVTPETYLSVVDHNENTPDVELEALLTWLQLLHEGPFSKVAAIWKLHPPHRWTYYYRMGEELTEIRLLNKTRRLLYEAWKKPYHFTGHTRRAKKSDVQSERGGHDGDNCGQLESGVLGTASKGTDQ